MLAALLESEAERAADEAGSEAAREWLIIDRRLTAPRHSAGIHMSLRRYGPVPPTSHPTASADRPMPLDVN